MIGNFISGSSFGRHNGEGGNLYLVCILGRQMHYLPSCDKIVAFWAQGDCHATSKKNECEDVSILNGEVRRIANAVREPRGRTSTFSRHFRRKLIGSFPYLMAEPMTGNQWKTSGGSEGSLGLICVHQQCKYSDETSQHGPLTNCHNAFKRITTTGTLTAPRKKSWDVVADMY